MRLSKKCRRLIDEIEAIFIAGIPIDSGVLRFVSTMGETPSHAFFARILTDGGDCEAESLIALIFSPDEAMQGQLEALLETEHFDATDEKSVIEMLTNRHPEARLFLSWETEPVRVSVPSGAISAFVSRLHIERKLSPRLIAAIESQSSWQTQTLLKVWLRNNDLSQTASEIDFLCLFFKKMKETSADFFPCFDFLLAFLGECPNETDYQAALIRVRQHYEQLADRARQFEVRLSKSNMETLMLLGDRPPVMGAAHAREKIESIDTLLHALYGCNCYRNHSDY
jgi:hypothetical protein